MTNVNRRRYASAERRAKAEATQKAILEAAQELFVEKGYAATSIREIARQAKVSEPTAYAVFRDKATLLWAALERVLSGTPVPLAESPLLEALRAEGDPRERLRLAVSWGTGDLFDRGIAELLDVIFQAAATDERFEAFARQTLERRHADSRLLTDVISGGGRDLRSDKDPEDVADLMEAIVSVPFYRTLVRDRGWSPEKYQDWALRIAEWLFFGDPNSRSTP